MKSLRDELIEACDVCRPSPELIDSILARHQVSQHEENTRLIAEDACINGVWADHGTKSAKEITLRFSCFGVTLYPNGTYCLSDYSG